MSLNNKVGNYVHTVLGNVLFHTNIKDSQSSIKANVDRSTEAENRHQLLGVLCNAVFSLRLSIRLLAKR